MKKMGFTLVELMVAIAIMSILAVLVVPKVASHVVKAKASEISPAAMTYTKLQSAYLYEHKAFGSWRKIGYEAPGGKKAKTETFKYSKGDVTVSIKGEKLSSTLGGDGLVAWQAENRVGLGKCHVGNKWQIRVISESENEIEYRPEIVQSLTSSGCVSLAKDWGNFDLHASLVTAPNNYAGLTPSSSGSAGTPGSSNPSTPSTPGEVAVAGGGNSSGSLPGQQSSSSAKSSSSAIQVAEKFYDEEEQFEDEDDGSCGVKYTSAGNRCPPSWCKLNGNVSRNHGGWNSAGHKWNECYEARQELIQEAAEKGLVNCNKNGNVCKVAKKGDDVVVAGNKISTAAEEGEYDVDSFNGKRGEAILALGGDVACVEDKNESACRVWRLANECEMRRANNSCSVWYY